MYIDETSTKLFIWSKLLKRDFHIPKEKYLSYKDKQFKHGTELLSDKIESFFDTNSLPFMETFKNVKVYNPVLWESLPNICVFGYSIGKYIHLIRNGSQIKAESVALASAIFNMGIALFDYIIDETSSKDQLLAVVNNDFLDRLMDIESEGSSKSTFSQENGWPTEQLLALLISGFGIACKALYGENKNSTAWNMLKRVLLDLYHAEKETASIRFDHNSSVQHWYEVFKRKSVVPFEVISIISWLAEEFKSDFQREKMQQICQKIGNIIWIADDLSDISKDSNAGIPGYVTIKAMLCSFRNTSHQTDLDLTGSITETIQDLFTYMDGLKTDLELIHGQENLRSQIFEFIHMYVYAWLA